MPERLVGGWSVGWSAGSVAVSVGTSAVVDDDAPADVPASMPANKASEGENGTFSVLVDPQKQARAARPGAPQAPQAARSAAAGGGQQVREIKRHFRLRGFATNIEIRYKTT